MQKFDLSPAFVSDSGRVFVNYREVAWPAAPMVTGSGQEFSHHERVAWLNSEFSDQEQDRPVLDEDIFVDARTLARDEATARELLRFEEDSPLIVDGEGNARGANPFSTDEGAAEWLQRVRSELRVLYREARSDQERAAIQAREAALRARHNARCYARAFARYHRLDENDTARMLDGWQKSNPIGWIGLEASMTKLFESCESDFFEARERWDAEFRASWDDEQKDEWLARMPEPPQHPTCLVSSVKRLRRHSDVPAENTLPRDEWAKACARANPTPVSRQSKRFRDASRLHRARTNAARLAARPRPELKPEWAEVQEGTQYAARFEWERAELVCTVKLDVPESLDFSGPGELDDIPAFVPSPIPPLHRCGERCAVCDAAAA